MPTGIYIRTKETRRILSEAQKGIRKGKKQIGGVAYHSEESRRKISESNKGRVVSKETRKKLSLANKGKKHFISKIARAKMVKAHLGKPGACGMLGKCHSEESKKKISKQLKKIWQNLDYRKEQQKIMHLACNIKPNQPEKRLRRELNKLFPKEYKYVGAGAFWIGIKNPDFINVNSQKKIIELFGDYWHGFTKTGRTKTQEENQRVKHFAKYGYETLIIWECELQNIKQLEKRLLVFHNAK